MKIKETRTIYRPNLQHRGFTDQFTFEVAPGDIVLRVGQTPEGFFYLYDAVTGRYVAFQRDIRVNVDDKYNDAQVAVIEVITDPRMTTDDDLERDRAALRNHRNEDHPAE